MTPPSPYVGKRRAVPAGETAVETAAKAPYVGKRRALPVEERVARPLPTRLVLHEPVLDRDHHEREDDDARITTGELRALVDPDLEDTAPHPRVEHVPHDASRDGSVFRLSVTPPRPADPSPSAWTLPGPRRFVAPVDPTRLTEPEAETAATAPLFSPDSMTIELPRISVAATYAADLTADTTTSLPAVSVEGKGGGRRRSPDRRSVFKSLPSLPAAVGACAIAAAVGGALVTAHAGSPTAPDTRVTSASALTGSSAVGKVGHDRDVPVSRGGGRTGGGTSDAQAAADKRARALTELDAKAENQDAFIKKNQWGLPIMPGVYHLTGRFGDVSGLWATVHTGLDFAAPYGTPIHAVARGVVTSTAWGGAYGNRTIVTLPDGTEIWYCHQSQYGTSVGDTVAEGQVIGYVGATGNVTGPHVHIEVRPGGGDPVDPDAAFKAHGIDPDANQ
ncbi:M23 family metallopeptidase [Nocardioides sp. DS6]|uniref:M23 family metallopeptidase n=1 Tax=Nocardioides eburneus TaxID=3231482 RepID=A0ABV3T0H5_9ACTN